MTYNSTYTGPQIDAAARLASVMFDDLPALLADARTYSDHTAGNIFQTVAENYRYRVAASDATDHHLTTGGGVKIYVQPDRDNIFNFGAFNPTADGVADCYDLLMLALEAYAIDGNISGVHGPEIFFPYGEYYFSQTVNITSCVRLFGNHQGGLSTQFPVLWFAQDTTGFIVNKSYTYGTGTITGGTSGEGSTFEGLTIRSKGGTDSTKHGIWMRATASIIRCSILYFPGNGVNIVASNDGNPSVGIANLWKMNNVLCRWNKGSGVYCAGKDANAGVGEFVSVDYNGRWGIEDRSFLGNTWISCHSTVNGVKAGADTQPTSVALYEGQHYHANPFATEADYVNTVPGTNGDVWAECEYAGNYFTWVPDLEVGTYIAGGPYCALGANSHAVFYNCYVEQGHGAIWVDLNCTYHGGIANTPVWGPGAWQHGSQGANRGKFFTTSNTHSTSGKKTQVTIGGRPEQGRVLSHLLGTGEEWNLRYRNGDDGADLIYGPGVGDSNRVFMITTANTAQTMGRSAPQPYVIQFPQGLAYGVGGGARRHSIGDAAPTTGAWARGDIVWNRDPVAAGWAGWICVTAGTPGTWKQFGAIEA